MGLVWSLGPPPPPPPTPCNPDKVRAFHKTMSVPLET